MIRGYDARQYALLQTRLEEFKHGLIALPRLINDVEALLNVLQSPNQEWVEGFHLQWMDLEIVYAIALDTLEQIPTYADSKIKKIVDAMVVDIQKIDYLVEDE